MTFTIDSARYEAAPRFDAYLASAVKHAELWVGLYRTAAVEPVIVGRLARVSRGWRILALSEDWCGDCVSTLPIIARLAAQAGLDFRVLPRDANLDLIDAHQTSGTRSIPVVMALDPGFRVRAWWGPRPATLQRWYRNEGLLLPSPERSRRKRAWYARDRGRSVIQEVVEMVERAARRAMRKPPGGID